MQLTDIQIVELARPLSMFDIVDFFKNPNNLKDYREWHLKKFGHYPDDAKTDK